MSVPQAPKRPDSLTTWFFSYTKLRFFSRMRQFLHLKAAKKHNKLLEKVEKPVDTDIHTEANMREESDWVVILQRSVKSLHFGSWEEKEVAAEEIKKLAKEDLPRRKTMAELGVIPPLVAMVGSEVVARQRLAVQTLIELANGSFTNKTLMVEAGILSKLPENKDVLGEPTMQEFAQLLLSISSAFANSQFSLSSSRIIPFVTHILESSSSTIQTKDSCLTTLYNLSSVLDNATSLATSGVVNFLLKLSILEETSEKALAILGNLTVTLAGEKALESDPMVPERLIEIMTWEERPKCQELSAYVLMILAHRSSLQRQKMAKAGIVPVLLEVALLGSPLAQKRALKILQWFKNERQMKMGPHSGPQDGRITMGSPVNPREVDEGKKLMKTIVKQSLYKNMETITRRANGEGDSSKLKSLVISSSSKSLPY
ncbi:U-box domain-containing protein 7-like [Olea europaea var. sylvestris]|uniref:U-box domain-containing protein 7-like n=1 Tax=Olea europaea var. sylvestris TaxID=158386 RepID=UPI000C1D7E95|nr:U-box domain-containing protein 7-like [Olea europaea var. sylvestris]